MSRDFDLIGVVVVVAVAVGLVSVLLGAFVVFGVVCGAKESSKQKHELQSKSNSSDFRSRSYFSSRQLVSTGISIFFFEVVNVVFVAVLI